MGRPPHSRTSAEAFALAGPTDLPDPRHCAFRKDLADRSLAGRLIASHYASTVERRLVAATPLLETASEEAAVIRQLAVDEPFALLDDSLGWAWGYAGSERTVGYVRSSAIGPGRGSQAQ